MNFSQIVLDKNLKKQVENIFSCQRIPHAIIIEGADEEKRREFAFFFSKVLMCTGEEKPCEECSDCKKMNARSHLDYRVYEGQGKTSAVNIEDIRELRNEAYVIPNEGKYKIYLVHNAHKMNEYSQNAILKCLEEPPEYVVILLECEEKSQLLETVRSRCATFRLGDKNDEEASQKKIDESKALAVNLAKATIDATEASLMSHLGRLEKDRELLKLCIKETVTVFRDAVIVSQTGSFENLMSDDKECVSLISQNVTVSQLIKMIDILNTLDGDVDKNANNSLLLSRMCYLLRRNAGR